MKKLGIYIGILSGLAGASASANEKTAQLYCAFSTEIVTWRLHAAIKAAEGFLEYAFDQYDAHNPRLTFQLNGSNREGLGASVLSWSSVSVAARAEGRTQITALGEYYDRATLVGKTEVEIVLEKITSAGLETFSLVSFRVNGVQYAMAGARSRCQFE